MKKLYLSLLALLFATILNAQLDPLRDSKGLIVEDFSQNLYPITGIHKKLNLDCKNCHHETEQKDYSSAMQTSCLNCHGSYAKLGEATGALGHNDNIHRNPHYEALDCDTCHKAHKPTVHMCLRCHTHDSMKQLIVK